MSSPGFHQGFGQRDTLMAMEQLRYLNNAATSYPKPAAVIEAVVRSLTGSAEEPGRTTGSADALATCRQELAKLFDVAAPSHVALLPSSTAALNTAISGLAKEGGKIVSTMLEHTSVLRPLEHLKIARHCSITLLEPDAEGYIEPKAVSEAIGDGADAMVMTCASNVTGAVQPFEEVSGIAAAAGIPIVLDASQSAGAVPLSHRALPGRVFVAFAGHKGLLGPTGTGGLIVPDAELPQLVVGGTGVRSESLVHPPELPLRHEAGTPNLPGFAGLAAGVAIVRARGVQTLGQHRAELVLELRRALSKLPGVQLQPLPNNDGRAGIVSFLCAAAPPEEIGFTLREAFGIEVRTGLHCAPLAHQFLGTAPRGTIRASVGPDNTLSDIDALVAAVEVLSQ